MPDVDLTQNDTTLQEGSAQPSGEPTGSASSPSVQSLAQQLSTLQQQNNQFQHGVASSLQQMAQFMSERLGPASPNNSPSAQDPRGARSDPTEDSIQSRLFNDPNAVLDEHFMRRAKEVFGPALNVMLEGLHDGYAQDLRTLIDGEFGDGAWQEHFDADYKGALEKLPVESRASRSTLRALVDGIAGRKRDELRDIYTKNVTTRRQQSRQEAPQMLAGGRSRPAQGTLTDEEQRWLADYATRAGRRDVDEKYLAQIRKARDPRFGWTLDDFPERPTTKGRVQ